MKKPDFPEEEWENGEEAGNRKTAGGQDGTRVDRREDGSAPVRDGKGMKTSGSSRSSVRGAARPSARTVMPLFLLFVYLLLLLTKLIPTEGIDSVAKLFFTLIVLELLVFALPSFLFCKLKGEDYVRGLSLNPFPLRRLGFLAAMTALLLSAGLLINALLYYIGLGSVSYTSLGSFILSEISLESNPLYVFFAYGAVPAIAEEFLFRGILFSEYKRYSFPVAAILSSALYAFSYFDLSGFFSYFLSGLILAFVVQMTGSLFAAILVRFVCNVASVYLMPSLWRLLIQPLGLLFAAFSAVALFLIFLIFALRSTEKAYLRMAKDVSYAADEPPGGRTVRFYLMKAVTAPSFFICFFTYVLVSVLRLVL